MARRKPRPGRNVVVRWVDSGLTQTGDPKDPRVGVLSICETHGKVISCEDDPNLVTRKGMSTCTLRLATNATVGRDAEKADMDIFSIWWPSVISVETG